MLGGGSAAGGVAGTVDTPLVPASNATEKRRSLLYPSAPAGPMSEEFPHTVAKGGQTFCLVLANTGILQRNGVDVEIWVVFVDHQFHDLHMLQASDGLPVDVCHKVPFPQATLPCRAFLVHLLQRQNEGHRITYLYTYTVGVITKFPYRLRSVLRAISVGFALGNHAVCIGFA